MSSPNEPAKESRPVDATPALLLETAHCLAAEMARVGHYNEADALLGELSRGRPPSPALLDLRARIRAQCGRSTAAEELWREASRLDPGNETYQAALRCLARGPSEEVPGGVTSFFPLAGFLAVILRVTGVLSAFTGLWFLVLPPEGTETFLLGGPLLFTVGLIAAGLSEGLRVLLYMEANTRAMGRR